MRAVILAGGRGTRLMPYTMTIPKPLVPVGERPILEIVIEQLKLAGVDHITLTVNHMAEFVMAFFGNGERFGVKIDYSIEKEPLGTVGPVKQVADLPETFLVLNGDLLTDVNLTALLAEHVASGARLTVATYKRDSQIDFGVVDVDERSGHVVGFSEKPTYHFVVSTGIYVYSRRLLDDVPDGPYGFDQLMLEMLARNEPINTYVHDGYWLDIGRPEDYEKANADLERIVSKK
jgi:NDP-mannose synthase